MKLVDAGRVAEILGVSQARTYELARTGILPDGVVVRLGRQIRFDEQSLVEWIRGGGEALPGGWRRTPE